MTNDMTITVNVSDVLNRLAKLNVFFYKSASLIIGWAYFILQIISGITPLSR